MLTELRAFEKDVERAMQVDRFALLKTIRSIRKDLREGKPADRRIARLVRRLERSIAICERRQARRPVVAFDDELPISARRSEIAAAIAERQVVVVCGETGSGKSTQLPKICLDAGRGIAGFIGHTQPRRIAARSIASRLAEELGTTVGGHVGFKIRFTDTVRPQCYVKLMTDGVLLAETQGDRFLDAYDTVILDEAHERSLNIDFLLGYFKRLLPRRPDFRLIITSATIDAERFAEHFSDVAGNVPIIEVSGRTYPVETRYRPVEDPDDDSLDGMLAAVEELHAESGRSQSPGDILVFLPTEREIREAAKRLRGWSNNRRDALEILPLYARLPTSEQQRVFHPGEHARIVLATNVAESSLTVPRIRYVIDTGTARVTRYSPRAKVQRLPIEPISQASADQRQGRCGRLGPGICVRLYDQQDYECRDRYTTPEIRRANLAAVILRMLALRLGDIHHFPFLDPPRAETVRDGYQTLFELGAIDQHQRLTEIGRRMARLPVDPRIARMILAADEQQCLADVLIIAAALEIQDPRLRTAGNEKAADQRHAQFVDYESDFLSLLKLWDHFHRLKSELSRSRLRKACAADFLSFRRLCEWQDVHRQLKQLVADVGFRVGERNGDYGAIHRALLAGLLSTVAMRTDGFQYLGIHETKSFLWPGSGVFLKKPKWVMSAELIETSKRYQRTVARIEPEWIEPLAEHLVKRSYSKPHWSRRRGAVLANQRISLFGLPVARRRQVPYGSVDPGTCRHLFIEHGLVNGELNTRFDFLSRNQSLVQRLAAVSARRRDASLLIPHAVQYAFYDERLPRDVFDVKSLRHWLKRHKHDREQPLLMHQSDLIEDGHDELLQHDFPDAIRTSDAELDVHYQYEPGRGDDGVNITLPIELMHQIDPERLEWGVPGMLAEKVRAMIRLLPKDVRRALIPAREVAQRVVEMIAFGAGPFVPTIAAALSEIAGETITPEQFPLDQLPAHLRFHIRAVDRQGHPILAGRDLRELQQSPTIGQFQPGVVSDDRWSADGLTAWTCGSLPESVEMHRAGCRFVAFPTLIDQRHSVALRLLVDEGLARRLSRGGLRRLFCLAEHIELRSQVAWFPGLSELDAAAAELRQSRDFCQQLTELIADRALFDEDKLSPTAVAVDAASFQQSCELARHRLPAAVGQVAGLLPKLMESFAATREALHTRQTTDDRDAFNDMHEQLEALTRDEFLLETPWASLVHFPRYFEAIRVRMDKLRSGGQARDTIGREQIRPLWERYRTRRQQHERRGIFDPELDRFRWMLEELRISLFAQQVGTAIKISPQRCEQQWDNVHW